jgi:UDP-glucuronate 4-epimerase
MTHLVTGTAGFIGYHVAEHLLERGEEVVGVDVVNDYYDVTLKEARLARLARHAGYRHERIDLADGAATARVFAEVRPERVIHLAAQAGVRYSLTNPGAYVQSNLVGFATCSRAAATGAWATSPTPAAAASTGRTPPCRSRCTRTSTTRSASTPPARRRTRGWPTPTPTSTGCRPRACASSPSTAPGAAPTWRCSSSRRRSWPAKPIDVFNHGRMRRDFTYVDDVVEGVVRVSDRPAAPDPDWSGDAPDPGSSRAPWRLYNIGNHTPVELMRLIELLEATLGREAIKNFLPMQPGDVPATFADVADLTRDTGFTPATPIEVGVERFVAWYRAYYRV